MDRRHWEAEVMLYSGMGTVQIYNETNQTEFSTVVMQNYQLRQQQGWTGHETVSDKTTQKHSPGIYVKNFG